MKYLETINKIIINTLKKKKNYLIYGQNINSGTYISGLSKNIDLVKKSKIFNTPNCEYSAIGAGFGVMIAEGNVIYFGKQLDFLLLGVDHFVNTLNAIKTNYKKIKGSYTIITFVCDQGFQGPQSSFNNIDDLSSLAQFDTYQINTLYEARKVIPYAINKRGFKIIAIGQRLSGQKIYLGNPMHVSKNYSFINYHDKKKIIIICSNFSFYYALELKENLLKKKSVGIININFLEKLEFDALFKYIKFSEELIFISDTKSINHRFFYIAAEIGKKFDKKIKYIYRNKFTWNVQKDNLNINL
jgi:pyruvate/2-oxoglutarate/acetoin dehydrogenase E1 component